MPPLQNKFSQPQIGYGCIQAGETVVMRGLLWLETKRQLPGLSSNHNTIQSYTEACLAQRFYCELVTNVELAIFPETSKAHADVY